MRTRTSTTAALAALVLAVGGLVPSALAAAPDPAYTVVGELELTEDELALTAVVRTALDGSTLYLADHETLLAVDLDTDERREVGSDHLTGWINDIAAHDGELYVLTRNPSALTVLDAEGGLVRTVDTGALTDSSRLDVAPDGTLFLLGPTTEAGALLRIGLGGTSTLLIPGSTPYGEFDDAVLNRDFEDIAVTAEHVVITDNRWRTVRIFDHDGAHLATIGEPTLQWMTIGSWEVSADQQGLIYAKAPYENVIQVHEIVTEPEGTVSLDVVARLPLTQGSTPRLNGGFGAPSVTETGGLVLTNATGVSTSRGNVLLLEPVLSSAWRDPGVLGAAEPGRTVRADVGVWPTGFAGTSLQWLRDGVAIPRETGATLDLVEADLGAEVALHVTVDYGARGTFQATSAPVTVTSRPVDPEPTDPEPARPEVGLRLAKTSVSRSAKPRVVVEVRGAETGRITVKAGAKKLKTAQLEPTHRGKITVTLPRLAVGKHRITASFEGEGPVVTSAVRTLRVKKARPTVTVKLAKKKVARGARAKVKVTVKVAGFAKPTGKVRVYDGKKRIKVVSLKAKHRGRLTIALPRLKPGEHRLKVVYPGTTQIAKRTSAKKTLTVRR